MADTKKLQKYNTEYDEAKKNFMYYYKPEFDRAYKLFASYNGDRAVELEQTTDDSKLWESFLRKMGFVIEACDIEAGVPTVALLVLR